jgi:hypothetical protein
MFSPNGKVVKPASAMRDATLEASLPAWEKVADEAMSRACRPAALLSAGEVCKGALGGARADARQAV